MLPQLLIALLGAVAVAGAVYVIYKYLDFDVILSWFKERIQKITANVRTVIDKVIESRRKISTVDINIPISTRVENDINSNNVNYFQGIFNTRTGKFTDGNFMRAEEVDDEVVKAHKQGKPIIYDMSLGS